MLKMINTFTPPFAIIIKFLLLPFLLIFILSVALILRFKKSNKYKKEIKSKKSVTIAMTIGGVFGGIYGIGPWIAGVFGSLEILEFFSFSNVTFLIFRELLGLKNYNVSLVLSVILWVLFGILYAFIINKIIRKGKQRHG